jgi:prophage regulatory protein
MLGVGGVGRPKKKGDDVVRGERFKRLGGTKSWTPSHWGAYVRGYQSGEAVGRQEVPSRASGRVLRVQEVLRRIKVSRSTLYRWSCRGLFPRPVQLGPGTIGYHEGDVTRWVSECATKGA